jgi:hypothetical protein
MNGSVEKILLACAAGLGFVSSLVHPFGEVKAGKPEQDLLSGATKNPQVIAVLERSCQDCHSYRTAWPWYSYVGPMSWLIEKDVANGRSHMNLSRWNEYSADEQQAILARMSSVVRNRIMPLPHYLLLHPAAKLSPADTVQIDRWSRMERRRLKSIAIRATVTTK